MSRTTKHFKYRFLVLAAALVLATGLPAKAKDGLLAGQVEPKRIDLVSGKSIVLRSEVPIKRIAVGNPEIADFNLLSPYEVHLTAKAAGSTNLSLWQDNRLPSGKPAARPTLTTTWAASTSKRATTRKPSAVLRKQSQ